MELKLNSKGLIPAIAQDADTGQVLMLGYMSTGSLKRTIESGQAWFYSRTREDLWQKGEVSGNYLHLKETFIDCDGDTILLKVKPEGPTCHTGNTSCFFRGLNEIPKCTTNEKSGSGILEELFAVIRDRQTQMPDGSYTADLIKSGIGRIAQKVTEEAGETAISAAQGDTANLPEEVADLLYHTLVLLAASDTKLEKVWEILRNRRQ